MIMIAKKTVVVVVVVKRSCRIDKRRRIDEIVQEAEKAAEQRDMTKVFKFRRLFSGRRTAQSKQINDRIEVFLSRTDDQLNQWKENFQEVVNRPAQEARLKMLESHHSH